MDLLIKTSAAAILALLSCLLIRKSNPELAALLCLAAAALVLIASLGMSAGFQELQQRFRDDFGLSLVSLSPVLKCAAAAVVTRITADLCKDHGQSAVAAAVEIAGCFCALGIVTPLLLSVLRMIGGFL